MKHSVIKLATVLLCFSFFSCTKNITETSFYYWKTKFHLSPAEKNTLQELHVRSLYVRFFDVDIDPDTQEPIPVGVIDGFDSIYENVNIIPVVFITNRTFLNPGKADISKLANNIIKKINSIKNNYNEFQVDCDWSGKTKENYFFFLEEVKKLISKDVKLTCTIRLHQVKYTVKTGVPPVNRGILMFYNMGDLSDMNGENSIYSTKIAEKYTPFLKTYELPLDVALPIFKWYVHYRNNAVIGLITKMDSPKINDTVNFKEFENSPLEKGGRGIDSENNTKFNVRTDHLENGIFYRTGDVLKFETISKEQLIEAAELLRQNLKQENRKIIFYDLDENNLNNYDKETFTKVITTFN
jgi:hypothetical protein